VIGNAITGELEYLIPDPGDLSKMTDTGTSASGIAADDQGNIYVADVGLNNLRKYVKVEYPGRLEPPTRIPTRNELRRRLLLAKTVRPVGPIWDRERSTWGFTSPLPHGQ